MNTKTSCQVIERCPIETTLAVIGGKWKPMILYHLRGGTKRFSALRRLMPLVTQRMLTSHLRELEEHGVIHREIFQVVPPRVEYSMTPLGHSLTPILTAMAEWGAAYERDMMTPVVDAPADGNPKRFSANPACPAPSPE
ncbi:MAG: helix-turn-helix domain-containing protein [Hyphomicrobiales bacterium]|nr:helix-turn-helix domain-containing protein [Hyphomicrobiales bacterium]